MPFEFLVASINENIFWKNFIPFASNEMLGVHGVQNFKCDFKRDLTP